jgi:hypothetical protein
VTDEALGRVARLTIDRGEARMRVELTDGRWHMTAPFPAQVEQGTVARLLDAFETARVKDVIAFQELRKRELSLRDFGLSPARIHVTLEGMQRRESFFLGAFTPLGNELYLRVDGSDQILVVPAALFDAIPQRPTISARASCCMVTAVQSVHSRCARPAAHSSRCRKTRAPGGWFSRRRPLRMTNGLTTFSIRFTGQGSRILSGPQFQMSWMLPRRLRTQNTDGALRAGA